MFSESGAVTNLLSGRNLFFKIKMKRLACILITFCALVSCTKARKCECVDSKYDRKEEFFINGTKKDSKKACANLADSTEVCTLTDK